MKQTLFALLSILMATNFSLVQSRSILGNEMRNLRNDVDLVAAEVAGELFDLASTRPFDANGAFGVGATFADTEDIDDFHGKQQTIQVPMQYDTLNVEVTATVQYVEKQGGTFVASGSPTDFKEIQLLLTGPLDTHATLSRVYADF